MLIQFARRKLPDFVRNAGGIATPQNALALGAIALAVAVLAAPALQGAVDRYAQNRALGIDRVLTGAVGPTNRMTVRQSVLSREPAILCGPGSRQSCLNR